MSKPFVFFDLGNVVLDFSGGLEDLASRFSVSTEQIVEIFLKHDNSICRGEIAPSDLLRSYEDTFRRRSGISHFEEYWVSFFRPIPHIHDFIDDLKKSGHGIGILTNIHPNIYSQLIPTGKIPNISYDVVVQSCETGFIKPEPQIFQYAEKLTHTKPSSIYFLDDQPQNVEMANSLGWRGILYSREKSFQVINQLRKELKICNSS